MTAETVRASDGWLGRLVTGIGRRVIPRRIKGCLRLTLPSGREYVIGNEQTGIEADMQIHNFAVIRRAMTRASIGFAESYMAGEWSSSDPVKLLTFYLQNRSGLRRAGRPFFFRSLMDRLWHRTRANTRAGSRRNIEAHYDLGNAFYRLWLDPGMTYSSALFSDPGLNLEAAQDAKYARVLESLQLSRGHHLLEIGCGWGSFAAAAVDRGAIVAGVTLSQEQLAHATKRLAGCAEFRLQDYRDIEGTFDRIASIEMIEAVGEENWPAYFSMIHDRLKPGGKAVLQAITIDEHIFPKYRRSADFIQRYIFPGGLLPTSTAIRKQAEMAGLRYEKLESFGMSYAKTLRLWRERFEAAWPEIAGQGFNERFRRMWTYYLAYCEAGFSERAIDVGLYRLEKPV